MKRKHQQGNRTTTTSSCSSSSVDHDNNDVVQSNDNNKQRSCQHPIVDKDHHDSNSTGTVQKMKKRKMKIKKDQPMEIEESHRQKIDTSTTSTSPCCHPSLQQVSTTKKDKEGDNVLINDDEGDMKGLPSNDDGIRPERKKKKKKKKKKKNKKDMEQKEHSTTSAPSSSSFVQEDLKDEQNNESSPLVQVTQNHSKEDTPTTTTTKSRKKRKKKGNDKKDIVSSTSLDGVVDVVKKNSSVAQSSCTTSDVVVPTMLPEFPFPVDADDHCESPISAYEDLFPILQELERLIYNNSNQKKKERSEKEPTTKNYQLALYDPYYCDGAVQRNLNELGFMNVYHQKENCYDTWENQSKYPSPLDVLITNPPYSDNHIEKLIHHITNFASSTFFKSTTNTNAGSLPSSSSPAWFLLLPTWVHKKEYYIQSMKDAKIQPFYLVPRKRRYIYIPPEQFRSRKKSDVHKKSSPFTSMWYCYGGNQQRNEQLIQYYNHYVMMKQQQGMSSTSSSQTKKNDNHSISPVCDLARTKNALRDLRRKA